MKTKKRYILLFVLLAVVLAGLLLMKPIYNLYRDVSFYWEERTEAEWEIMDFAQDKGISYGEYPYDLIDLYIGNPETREFVLNYPFREDMEVDLSAYERTGTVPLFLQWDPMWGYEDYGSSCIAVTGCGPTSLAMAGYYLTGDSNMTPGKVAKFAEKAGYYAPGYGSSWTLIGEGAEQLGLTSTELPLVKKKLVDALDAGHPVILAMGEGDFTSTGHYIVLTGYQEEGFTLNDPNSRVNSQKLWPYEQLESQIRNIWAISKA